MTQTPPKRRKALSGALKAVQLRPETPTETPPGDYKTLRTAQRRKNAPKGMSDTDELQRIAVREQAAKLAAEQAAQLADVDALEHHQRVQAKLAEHRARVLRASQEEALKELASRELARRSLLHFVCRMVPGYLPGWLHEDIARRLEKFLDDIHNKRSPRLLIAVPPRHGKSQLASVCFPAWALAKYPYMEMITCSYNQSLAEKFSRQAKWCMDDPDYAQIFPTAQRDPKNDSIDQWGLLGERGGYVAAGVGGGVTGKGAHCLIIDDPIKDAEQADSDTVKEGIWDWYGSTAYTRLAPGGGVLVIQTLWADDDLAGRLRQQMKDDPEADQFDVVLYPAIATEYEYVNPFTYETYNSPRELTVAECDERVLTLRRAPGDALHPDRYDARALGRIKKTLHPRYWSALYQQNPVPDDGAFFKKEWLRYSPLPSQDQRTGWTVTIAWDFAITERQESDYTVGSAALQDYEGAMWPLEQVRFRSDDSDKIIEAMINLLVKHYRSGVAVRMGVEDGQIWKTMQASFFRELKRRKLAHLSGVVEAMTPTTDKKVRATPLQGLMKLGMVYWPAPRPAWMDVTEHEMLRFPASAHDDCVDSWAWNARLQTLHEPPRRPAPRRGGRKDTLESKLKKHMAAQGSGRGRSHMSS